jgi:hypothetical protein
MAVTEPRDSAVVEDPSASAAPVAAARIDCVTRRVKSRFLFLASRTAARRHAARRQHVEDSALLREGWHRSSPSSSAAAAIHFTDDCACSMSRMVNAGPLGAVTLPLTDTLMTAAPAVRMLAAKPKTSPTAYALPYALLLLR